MKKVRKLLTIVLLSLILLSCGSDNDYSISYSYNEQEGYITDGENVIESGTTIEYSPGDLVVIEAFPKEENRVHFLGWWLENSFSFLGNDVTITYDNPYRFTADAVVDYITPRFEYAKNVIFTIVELDSNKKIIFSSNYDNRYELYMMDIDGANKEKIDLGVEEAYFIYPDDLQIIEENKFIVFRKNRVFYSYDLKNNETRILYNLPDSIELDYYGDKWIVDEELNYFITVYYSRNGDYCYRKLVYDIGNEKVIDNSILGHDVNKLRIINKNVFYLKSYGDGLFRYNIDDGNTVLFVNDDEILDFEISPNNEYLAWMKQYTGLCTIVDLSNNSKEELKESMYSINSWTDAGEIISIKTNELLVYDTINKNYSRIDIDGYWNTTKDNDVLYLTASNEECFDIVKIENETNIINLTENW